MALEVSPAREQAELEEYLGERFELRRLQQYELELEREFAACGDDDAFYRSSEAYLYNLTAFAMTRTKLPYLRQLVRLVEPGSRVLDYGCGIGSDGLALLEAGYEVEFADFDNPSTEYLRWRLSHRGLAAPVWNLDVEVPDGFDAAYAFDVIEHVADPFAFLAQLERRAGLVVVNLLEPGPAEREPASHHELPIDAIRARAVDLGLRSYRIHHGRSHLVAYEPGEADALARLRGRAAIMVAKARRRLG
jgi:SAM-dependent methyltransferase